MVIAADSKQISLITCHVGACSVPAKMVYSYLLRHIALGIHHTGTHVRWSVKAVAKVEHLPCMHTAAVETHLACTRLQAWLTHSVSVWSIVHMHMPHVWIFAILIVAPHLCVGQSLGVQ